MANLQECQRIGRNAYRFCKMTGDGFVEGINEAVPRFFL
jgi:hypothetical protein